MCLKLEIIDDIHFEWALCKKDDVNLQLSDWSSKKAPGPYQIQQINICLHILSKK